jgi:hypothetical protein
VTPGVYRDNDEELIAKSTKPMIHQGRKSNAKESSDDFNPSPILNRREFNHDNPLYESRDYGVKEVQIDALSVHP